MPDLFVVRGLAALPEPSYRVWVAGRPPGFVLVASPSTEGRHRVEKHALYASTGVAEHWRFSPAGMLKGASREGDRLEGSVLVGLGYEPLASTADGSIRSEVLGLEVRVDDRPGMEHLLRFRDPRSGKDLLTFRESERARAEAVQALGAEVAARHDAESEIARLKARITELQTGRVPGGTVGSP